MDTKRRKFLITSIIIVLLGALALIFFYPVRSKITQNYLKKADAAYSERNWTEAEKYYQKSISWDSKNQKSSYFKLAVCQYNLSSYDKAITNYNSALNDPQSNPVRVLNNIGNSYRDKKDYVQAMNYYDQAIEKIKNNVNLFERNPFVNKVALYIIEEKYQQAIDTANSYLNDQTWKNYLTSSDFQSLIDIAKNKLK